MIFDLFFALFPAILTALALICTAILAFFTPPGYSRKFYAVSAVVCLVVGTAMAYQTWPWREASMKDYATLGDLSKKDPLTRKASVQAMADGKVTRLEYRRITKEYFARTDEAIKGRIKQGFLKGKPID